jgi:hypothetical protein
VAVVAPAAAVLLAPPATDAALLAAVAAAVLAEAAVARRRTAAARASPDGPDGQRGARRRGRTARVITSTALAGGLAAYVLGRTGGPLCRPDSLLQPHALWHLLTAVAMAAWGADRIAHPVRARPAPGRDERTPPPPSR